MTVLAFTDYIYHLKRAARSATVAEENLRREIAQRFSELERERQFAFCRYNLRQAVARALGEAANKEEALAKCRTAFMRELASAGVTEQQRVVIERFAPVILAVWKATHQHEAGEPGIVAVKRVPAIQ